ncbi:hypothetical protein Ae406Ps2_1404c [Pseudonocardia sp. Ae406_Ps2]|nr:hypothetical protein Ae406Ps2_1404c [Pseudonocardia sp. Ae406_Ps2]OLM06799.1 hypothetical protein Ae331Ps2_4509 [Pseudonocardia sp. Ae331_Ps2]OLM14913.1 hypothetical protein Ae505Ps2_5045c [Pseudonocardia sp. Ae505_Ps2]OLM22977.1 hypothetical protein Ae706Ps2_1409c [Pseudonocardia sp. Ae706_Ps2]
MTSGCGPVERDRPRRRSAARVRYRSPADGARGVGGTTWPGVARFASTAQPVRVRAPEHEEMR